MNFQNGKLAWKRIVNGFFFIRVIRGIRGQQLTGREPLLHFIMIGAAIYLLLGWLGLVRNHLRETVLYREDVAMGLDKDDVIIRRRMAQKLGFLAQDLITPKPPGQRRAASPLRTAYRSIPDTPVAHVRLDVPGDLAAAIGGGNVRTIDRKAKIGFGPHGYKKQ